MKIKVFYRTDNEGIYTVHSPVFPNCRGKGNSRGESKIELIKDIKQYIENAEKECEGEADTDMLIL